MDSKDSGLIRNISDLAYGTYKITSYFPFYTKKGQTYVCLINDEQYFANKYLRTCFNNNKRDVRSCTFTIAQGDTFDTAFTLQWD